MIWGVSLLVEIGFILGGQVTILLVLLFVYSIVCVNGGTGRRCLVASIGRARHGAIVVSTKRNKCSNNTITNSNAIRGRVGLGVTGRLDVFLGICNFRIVVAERDSASASGGTRRNGSFRGHRSLRGHLGLVSRCPSDVFMDVRLGGFAASTTRNSRIFCDHSRGSEVLDRSVRGSVIRGLRPRGGQIGGRTADDAFLLCGTAIPTILIRYKFLDGATRLSQLGSDACRRGVTFYITGKVTGCLDRSSIWTFGKIFWR